jgi:endonuclease III
MKGGAGYAKKIKKLFGQLKRAHGLEYPEPPGDLVEVLVLAVLSTNTSDRRARVGLNRIIENTVDINEFRVTSPGDMPSIFGSDYPDSVRRSKALAEILGDVFNRENAMSLVKVADKSKREARDYLESLAGSSPFVAAYVLLWGLGGHAIPVDDHLAAVLRKEEWVDPAAEPAEIQAFLERHIPAAEGKAMATSLRRYAATKSPKTSPAAPPLQSESKKVAATKIAQKKAARTKRVKKTKKKTVG